MVLMKLSARQDSHTDVEKGLWAKLGKERLGSTERAALTYIHYHG